MSFPEYSTQLTDYDMRSVSDELNLHTHYISIHRMGRSLFHLWDVEEFINLREITMDKLLGLNYVNLCKISSAILWYILYCLLFYEISVSSQNGKMLTGWKVCMWLKASISYPYIEKVLEYVYLSVDSRTLRGDIKSVLEIPWASGHTLETIPIYFII